MKGSEIRARLYYYRARPPMVLIKHIPHGYRPCRGVVNSPWVVEEATVWQTFVAFTKRISKAIKNDVLSLSFDRKSDVFLSWIREKSGCIESIWHVCGIQFVNDMFVWMSESWSTLLICVSADTMYVCAIMKHLNIIWLKSMASNNEVHEFRWHVYARSRIADSDVIFRCRICDFG